MAVYTGTAANNTYTGTGSADTIAGRGGNDKLYGGNGNDRILGEDGNDTLFGGNGIDLLFGGNGNDSLDGGVGNDSLDGGDGNDLLLGLAGSDRLQGGNGNDSMAGGNDADTVFASLGNDRIDGGTGNDSLAGGDGTDTVAGATGNDRIDGGNGNDSLAGGAGADTVTDTAGDDSIDGGSGNDSIAAGDGADAVAGGTGNDVIDGGAGNDSLAGGDGADTVTGAIGNDSIDGGAGTDTVVFAGSIASYQITGIGGGVVRFVDLAALDGDDGTDLVRNAETVVFANRTVTFASLLNTAPVAGDDRVDVGEDGPAATGSLFGNDQDPDGNTLTVASVNGLPGNVGSTILLASGARLLVGPNGTYRFDPNGGYESLGEGQDATYRFTYTVSDGRGGSDGASVTVTIAGANDAPEAGDDAIAIDQDEVASGSLLGNDDDPDAGDGLTVIAVDGSDTAVGTAIELASGALLTVNADGSYSYDPDGAFAGLGTGETDTDSFTYTVSDGNGATDTATVEVTITGSNGTPDAVDDGFSADEDTGASGNDLLDNDTDPDDDPLTVSAVNGSSADVGQQVTLASGARLTVNADGSYSYDTNGKFEALGDGETDTDSFTYTVSDGNGGTDTATVEVTITGANDVPDAVDDTIEVDAGSTGSDILGSAPPPLENLLANDVDPDGDGLTVTAVNGSDTAVGTQIELASGAILQVSADGSYSYDPNGAFDTLREGETDTDSFTYTVSDGNGGSDAATVDVTITGSNGAPDAVDDPLAVAEDGSSSGSLTSNDTDPDGDDLSVIAVNGSDGLVGDEIELASGALVTVNADGSYSYDTNGSFDSLRAGSEAVDSFTYTISDGHGGTDSATVEITVSGANDAPIAGDDTVNVTEDIGTADTLLGNDEDAEGDPLTVIAVNGSDALVSEEGFQLTSGAWLQLNAGGSFAYTPNGAFEWLADGESGSDSFTYTISDGQGGTDTATVTVEIAGVNDSPDAVNHEYEIDEDAVVDLGSLLVGASDPDRSDVLVVIGIDDIPVEIGVPITLLKVGQVGAAVTVDEDYHLIYDPNGGWSYLAEGQVGSETVTYTIDDQHAGYDTATFTVIVTGTNDAPEAEDDSIAVDEDAVTDGSDLFANDVDPDALDELSIVAVNGDDEAVGVALETTLGAFVTVRADGTYSYDPNGQFNGLSRLEELIDSFTYTVSDNHGVTDTASVEVIIKGNNEPCDAVDDEIDVHENDGVEDSLLTNDSDEDLGDTLYVVAVNGSAGNVATSVTLASGASIYVDIYGTLTVTPNGAYDYLAEGETTEESFTYTISDDGDTFDTATVTLSIVGVNDVPTADDANLDVYEVDGTYSGNLLDYAADPDLNDTLVISAINGASAFAGPGFQIETGAWLTVSADGSFSLEPPRAANTGETLEGSFDYTVSDGNGGFATATISFTVYGAGVEV